MSSSSSQKTILILSSNPKGTDPLRLDEELREIKAGIQRSRHRDQFRIECQSAVRARDMQRAMLDYKPQIVHFCGHGDRHWGLVLEDEVGKAKPVSGSALASLFELFADQLECVVLNACDSGVHAAAISQHIPYVIGMNQGIGDRAAIEFATSFYDALGAGESIEFAFRLGKNAVQLAGIAEENTPVLVPKPKSESSKPLVTPAQPDRPPVTPATRSRIFISYKRGVEPDEPIALAVHQALSASHDVFIDQQMPVGTPWAQRIEQELRRSDFLITFLSARSVQSEMVEGEIRLAHRLMQEGGKPRILPVRLAYREPFVYSLSHYLNPINWAFWQTDADTPRLISELMQAIAGGDLPIQTEASKAELLETVVPPLPLPLSSAQPIRTVPKIALESAEGTMDPESQFYVQRPADAIALSTIERQGVTLTIKGPRQMGKSSLLMRIIDAAMQVGKRVVFLDFQVFDQEILQVADVFYRQFCTSLTEQLGILDRVAEYWDEPGGNVQRCTRYMQTHVLKSLGAPLLLAMDEVDRMFDTDYRSDFFSMLRSWHNNRALPTMRMWKQFDLALVTATEPYHLIANLNQSPFNVGEVILLTDFTPEQVGELNRRHGSPLTMPQERELMGLLNGQPYLVRRAFYLVASQQLGFQDLLSQAISDRGPFGDHLRYHLFRIYDKPELVQGLRQVIRTNACSDERIVRLLVAAGLVTQTDHGLTARCQLYAKYFQEHLRG